MESCERFGLGTGTYGTDVRERTLEIRPRMTGYLPKTERGERTTEGRIILKDPESYLR